jgi:transcriptional regulator with XRE-family HTH domain
MVPQLPLVYTGEHDRKVRRVTSEEHFAARLRALRVDQGVSQSGLAATITKRLGYAVDGSAITRLEKGERLIRLGEAVAIAEALGAPLTSMVPKPQRVSDGREDPTIQRAADVAPRALGEFIGDAVAVVLLDHALDEHPDPNIHELAHCVLMLARLGGGE